MLMCLITGSCCGLHGAAITSVCLVVFWNPEHSELQSTPRISGKGVRICTTFVSPDMLNTETTLL